MPTDRPFWSALAAGVLAVLVAAPGASAGTGGAEVPTAGGGAGGAAYGSPLGGVPRPQAVRFSVSPRTVTAGGRLPAIVLRIAQPGSTRVRARLDVTPARGTGGRSVRIVLGQIRVGRTLRPGWPKGARLRAGRYTVRIHATDIGGLTLARPRRAPGRVTLDVRPKPKPKPAPTPKPAPAPSGPATPATPRPTVGGRFPVAGPFTFTDGFGAARDGYGHQGVDIAAAAGTNVVAPTAATVRYTDYQSSAAGEYIVARLADGRDIFLAHCIRHSTTVAPGQRVAAGAVLCRVGSTGRSSGPHLHFELWPDGWRDIANTAPVDPLPQLRRWAR
ncbi:metallo-endopeptidase [Paraconexibacter sp. AEG42_29]|uniref:Metallo-endopeptidase n=1 Tax=Paraconexibacter sp. AEG42_29 TaxID=2997339 RepID=A0AAU7B2X0_9ACTN